MFLYLKDAALQPHHQLDARSPDATGVSREKMIEVRVNRHLEDLKLVSLFHSDSAQDLFSDRLYKSKLDGGQLNSFEIRLIDIVHVFHSLIHSESLSPSEPSHMQWKPPKCSICRKDVLVETRDLPIQPG